MQELQNCDPVELDSYLNDLLKQEDPILESVVNQIERSPLSFILDNIKITDEVLEALLRIQEEEMKNFAYPILSNLKSKKAPFKVQGGPTKIVAGQQLELRSYLENGQLNIEWSAR